MKTKILLISLGFLLAINASSQVFQSAYNAKGGGDMITSCMDRTGNYYATGRLNYSFILNNDTVIIPNTDPKWGKSWYVSKLGSDGKSGYVREVNMNIYAMAGDNEGNLYLPLAYGNAKLVIGKDTMKADVSADRVLFGKFDGNMKVVFKKHYTPTTFSSVSEVKKMVTDNLGNMYAHVAIGYGKTKLDTATLAGGEYIVKFNKDGFVQNYHAEAYNQEILDFVCDNENNFIEYGRVNHNTFSSARTQDFGNGVVLNFPYLTSGKAEFYIAKYNSNGVCQWATLFNNSYDATYTTLPEYNGIAIDYSNNVFIFGLYTGTARYNGVAYNVPNNFNKKPYVAKFKNDGKFGEFKTLLIDSLMGDAAIRTIAFDPDNKMYVMCNYPRKGFKFCNISMPYLGASSSGDRFIARVNTKWECEWWKFMVNPENKSIPQIIVTKNNEMFIGGGSFFGNFAGDFAFKIGTQIWDAAISRAMFTEDAISKGKTGGFPYILKFSTLASPIKALNNSNLSYTFQNNSNSISISNHANTPFSVNIVGLNGQTMLQSAKSTGVQNLNISNLKPGIYIVQMISENGVCAKKFVK